MDRLRCLNSSSLHLLNNHNLLKTLVKLEIRYLKVNSINISEEEKRVIMNKFKSDNQIDDEKKI